MQMFLAGVTPPPPQLGKSRGFPYCWREEFLFRLAGEIKPVQHAMWPF